MDIISKSQ